MNMKKITHTHIEAKEDEQLKKKIDSVMNTHGLQKPKLEYVLCSPTERKKWSALKTNESTIYIEASVFCELTHNMVNVAAEAM